MCKVNIDTRDLTKDMACEPLISRRALIDSMEKLWDKEIAKDAVLNRVYYTIRNAHTDISVDVLVKIIGDLAKMSSDAIEAMIKYEQNSAFPRVG